LKSGAVFPLIDTCIRQIIRGGKLSRFLLTENVLPLEIFLEYWRRPLTTQSMVPPGLINNEQSVEMLRGTWPTICYQFLTATAYRSLESPSYKPAVLRLPASSTHDNADRTVFLQP